MPATNTIKVANIKAPARGYWVDPAEFGRLYAVPPQTLAKWRLQDRKAGRSRPLPGYPRYKLIDGFTFYWVPVENKV